MCLLRWCNRLSPSPLLLAASTSAATSARPTATTDERPLQVREEHGLERGRSGPAAAGDRPGALLRALPYYEVVRCEHVLCVQQRARDLLLQEREGRVQGPEGNDEGLRSVRADGMNGNCTANMPQSRRTATGPVHNHSALDLRLIPSNYPRQVAKPIAPAEPFSHRPSAQRIPRVRSGAVLSSRSQG